MPRTTRTALAALAVLALAGCGNDAQQDDPSSTDLPGPSVSGELVGPAGEPRGSVTLSFGSGGTVVDVEAEGLEPGFHGFHLHETGQCEPDSAAPSDPGTTGPFLSAGGHLSRSGEDHGDHAGDLPPLLVGADGRAVMTVTSDRLTEADVLDDDGTAVMVHAGPDNLGNIPERYAPGGPDEMTLSTGDSGGRVACAALTAADLPGQ
ncbi:MAG TPA: superoxide dismutase family protein [Mycobacteriales bacterium]|nr:superoxide dismutase family protein [Mycobacteriales bacterium]